MVEVGHRHGAGGAALTYFNEIDPFCVEWLTALYPDARVDHRSIHDVRAAGAGGSGWDDFLVLPYRDGKYRRISAQPGDEPLAHGIPTRKDDPRLGYVLARLVELGHSPKAARRILREARRNRVGRLRGYGNALVPDTACLFIRCVMEVIREAVEN